MQNPSSDDQRKLIKQWQADAASLKEMVKSMQSEIAQMRDAKAPNGHIELREEMIVQYKTTISKLEALIEEND